MRCGEIIGISAYLQLWQAVKYDAQAIKENIHIVINRVKDKTDGSSTYIYKPDVEQFIQNRFYFEEDH